MPTRMACFYVFSTGNLLNSHALCRSCICAKVRKYAFQNKTKVDGQVFNTVHQKRSQFHALFMYFGSENDMITKPVLQGLKYQFKNQMQKTGVTLYGVLVYMSLGNVTFLFWSNSTQQGTKDDNHFIKCEII